MKEKTIKTIKGISIAVLIMIAIVTCLETYFWSERWQNVEWNEEIIGWQRRIVISHIATTYLLVAVMVTFIINIFRGLKKGVIFSRCNTIVIYAGAVIYALNSFYGYTAMNAATGRYVHSIDTDMCIYPLLIIILGLLHKLAVEASEENNLTI